MSPIIHDSLRHNLKINVDWAHAIQLRKNGYSILELVAVIGVMSILAGISVPAFLGFIAESNVDELKALLNSAAADCLQKNRTSNGTNQKVDEAIISNAKLNTLGYAINSEYATCSYLEILPIEEKDAIRFPIGFSVTNGLLLKSASVSEYNNTDSACRSWAGSNCKSSKELKDFIEYNKQIEDAEETCNTNYANWTKSNPTACTSTNRWDPSANSSCPTRPPKQMSSTCTPNGCNVRAFAFEGKIYNSEDACQSALTDAWQKKCDDWVDTQSKIDNDIDTAETNQYCGTTQYWFCDGSDKKNMEDMNSCLQQKANLAEETSCKANNEKAARDGISGAHKSMYTYKGETKSCPSTVYICQIGNTRGEIYTTKPAYDAGCIPTPPTNTLGPGRPNPGNPNSPANPQNPDTPNKSNDEYCQKLPPGIPQHVRDAVGC